MSRQAIKKINWSAIAEKIMEVEKPHMAALKAKSDLYFRRMSENPEQLPKIDWSYYEKNIAAAGLVEKFRKSYESIQVAYPQDKYTQLIDEEEKQGDRDIKQFVEESNKRIEEYKEKLEKYYKMTPFDEMSLEEFHEHFPRIPVITSPAEVDRIQREMQGAPPSTQEEKK